VTWKNTFFTVDFFGNKTLFIYTEEEHPLNDFTYSRQILVDAIEKFLFEIDWVRSAF
jgi:hypothetical protein